MDIGEALKYYFLLWFITIPLTYFIVTFIVTELLDLILNMGKIDRLLKHSDSLNLESLVKQYEVEKFKQSGLSQTFLKELERQTNVSAKKMSDIFKVK